MEFSVSEMLIENADKHPKIRLLRTTHEQSSVPEEGRISSGLN